MTGYLKKEKQFLENWKWNLPYFMASIKWNKELPWWLSGRVCLPVQGTWVWALIQEDPTCRGATKSVHHNHWACALESGSRNYAAHALQLLEPVCLEPRPQQQENPLQWEAHSLQLESSPRSPQLEKSPLSNKDPEQPEIKINKIIFKK